MDPLQEDEYWSEFRNAYSSDVLAEGFDFDSHAEQSTRGEYNYVFGSISPQNKITAENSAVHYSVSPYPYVLNNLLIYNDPLGLDNIIGKQGNTWIMGGRCR